MPDDLITQAVNQVIDQMFSIILDYIKNFIEYDVAAITTGIIFILLIIYAFVTISRFLESIEGPNKGLVLSERMSQEEKDARRDFNNFNASRGKFNEPLYRKKYMDSLKRYRDVSEEFKSD